MGLKENKVKILLLLVIVILCVVGFLTLGGKGGAQQKKPIVVIHFAHWRVEDLGVFNQIIKQYERENPGVLVVQDVEDANEYRNDLSDLLLTYQCFCLCNREELVA